GAAVDRPGSAAEPLAVGPASPRDAVEIVPRCTAPGGRFAPRPRPTAASERTPLRATTPYAERFPVRSAGFDRVPSALAAFCSASRSADCFGKCGPRVALKPFVAT